MKVTIEFNCGSAAFEGHENLVHQVGHLMTQATYKMRNQIDDVSARLAICSYFEIEDTLYDTNGAPVGTIRVTCGAAE